MGRKKEQRGCHMGRSLAGRCGSVSSALVWCLGRALATPFALRLHPWSLHRPSLRAYLIDS